MAESRHNDWTASARRLRLIAAQALVEALRLRLTGLFVAGAGMGLLASRWLRNFNFGATEIAFLGDLGLGMIGLAGTVFAVLLSAHLFLDDLPGMAGCVLARPVRRWEFVVGKWLGVSGVLGLFTTGLGAFLGGLLAWRSRQLGVATGAVPIFVCACALQWMKFTLVAAMTFCVSAYARSVMFAACAGLMLAIIGHLRPFATGGLEWLRIWPNLTLFAVTGFLDRAQLPTGRALVDLAAYWGFCCACLGTAASVLFSRREF